MQKSMVTSPDVANQDGESAKNCNMPVVNTDWTTAGEKNKGPILQVLKEHSDQERRLFALEIASGPGQHVVHFAEHMPNVTWQPSECDKDSLQSIAGYIAAKESKNVLQPVFIDASQPLSKWAGGSLIPQSCDLIVNINMIHISPWSATEGLFKAAGVLLKPGAIMATYGPYMINGMLTPESNVRFDQSLKERCPEWGIRDTADLEKLAKENALTLEKMVDMPANNKVLLFKKTSQ
ncbi:methyltransferase-like 26 isoform X1 [Lingula anatina]|uniref:Methyltransferase-like 26 isoform X1 n=2 Tax=Lingula anatina TaxID=7574 RepID=A0A1S3JWX4_LINAN|nr:methyltransferase-like 26 isoform X1 [Lingula anatina]|eukprot:XP_013414878.1 methyltransferase-like 26 isoform X1 [Lingula anatina]